MRPKHSHTYVFLSFHPVPSFSFRADLCVLTPPPPIDRPQLLNTQDPIKVQIHDKQVEELERSLDPPLNVLFIRQLLTLRDKARAHVHTYAFS